MNKGLLTHVKAGMLLPPELKDNGDFAGNTYFDCDGLDALLVLLCVGVTDAAIGSDAETAAPYLEECDTTDGTYTKISGSDLSAVIAATDDGKIYGWSVDRTKTRKRYLRIMEPHSGDGTTGANACAIAIGLPQIAPVSAAQMGLAALVQV